MIKLNELIQTNKGFTLVEVIITIAILGIVLPMIFSMITNIYTTVIPSIDRMHAKESAQLNLIKISRYIRNTNSDNISFKYNTENNILKFNDQQINNIKDYKYENNKILIEKFMGDDCKDDNCEIIIMNQIVIPRNKN